MELEFEGFKAALGSAILGGDEEALARVLNGGIDIFGQDFIFDYCAGINPVENVLELPREDCQYFQEWFANYTPTGGKLVEGRVALAKELIAEGFTPGKDFSFDVDGMFLSDEVRERLIETTEPNRQLSMEALLMVSFPPMLAELLHSVAEEAGVDRYYFHRLVVLAHRRLAPYWGAGDVAAAYQYVDQLLEGTITRFPSLMLGEFVVCIWYQVGEAESVEPLMEREPESLSTMTEAKREYVNSLLWQDIIAASGMDDDGFKTINGEWCLSLKAAQIIDSLWSKKGIPPLAEAIAILRQEQS